MNLKKSLIYGISAVLALLVGLVVLIQLLVTPERIKGWAVPLLEENLQREVSLGNIDVGLFSGITLTDLQIRDKDSQNDLLKIGELVLRYRLIALLSGQLVIDDVHLLGPEIRLVQNPDGSMNIDDLLSSSEAEKTPETSTKKTEKSVAAVDLLVSRVLLENGQVLLVRKGDEANNLHLQDIQLLVKNVSLDKAFPLELSFRLNETDFSIAGDFDPANSKGRLDLSAKQLYLNRFVPKSTTAESSQQQPKKDSAPAEEPGPIEIPLTLTGTVKIDEMIYQDFTVKEVIAEYQLASNHFRLLPLSGNIAEGKFNLQTDVDLCRKGFAYTGEFSLDGLNLQSLIPTLVPEAKNSTHGIMQVKLNFNGSGIDPARALDQLKSQGSFVLSKGKLMGSPLLTQFAKFLNNPELKVLSFQSLTGEYDLKQGLAQIKAALDSSKVRIDSSGTVDLDGQLDLQFATKLAPEVVKGSSVGGPVSSALTDPTGWVVLPLKISGTYSDPKFRLSSSGLRTQVKEKVTKKLTEKLQDKLGEDESPVKGLLDKPLKKLFGD